MFVGKAKSIPKSGAPEMCFTQVGSGLTHKYQARLEKNPRGKYSSLLQKSVNYGRKKFCNIGLRNKYFCTVIFKVGGGGRRGCTIKLT